MLKELGGILIIIKIMSEFIFLRERDESINLTDCLNGDRFLYAKEPIIPPLNRNMKIANENCVIFHKTHKKICIRYLMNMSTSG